VSRNLITEGIILRTTRFGEIHKSVTILSPERGIIHAIAHGALKMKSKLRSSTQPFSKVKAYIYYDPVKDSYKITDIETIAQYFGVSESVEKYYAASLFSEIILKSFGGGESGGEAYPLLRDAFENLGASGDLTYVIIQFIYRYLGITGYSPQLRSCSRCGRIFDDSIRIFFHSKTLEFLCSGCCTADCTPVLPGMIRYLEKTGGMEFSKAMEIKVEKGASIALKTIMYSLIESLLEVTLSSIRTGKGII
jgi:DNA repair protein RecO (recombination protein O)